VPSLCSRDDQGLDALLRASGPRDYGIGPICFLIVCERAAWCCSPALASIKLQLCPMSSVCVASPQNGIGPKTARPLDRLLSRWPRTRLLNMSPRFEIGWMGLEGRLFAYASLPFFFSAVVGVAGIVLEERKKGSVGAGVQNDCPFPRLFPLTVPPHGSVGTSVRFATALGRIWPVKKILPN
jgi:hypothetical protein